MNTPPTPSKQLRIRTSQEVAARLLSLSPRARSRAVSMMIAASMERVDLAALLAMRVELVRLGNLLNQALRASRGQAADPSALQAIVTKLGRVLR